MNIYNFAPKTVIDSLSPKARKIVELRINNKNNHLKPYVPTNSYIRIRGLKPGLLYINYSVLNEQNILESRYVVESEENQCSWVSKIMERAEVERTKAIDKSDYFIRTMTEASWCEWEDAIMSGQVLIPEAHIYNYTDIANNTFFHCIAYAFINRDFVDFNHIHEIFCKFNFHSNPDLLKRNDLDETPLQILMQHPEMVPFVESILLQLSPEIRLKALSFVNWSKYWGDLMNNTVNNFQECRYLIKGAGIGFINIFLNLTHNSIEALCILFNPEIGYRLKLEHVYAEKLSHIQKHDISLALRTNPNWHNLTIWMYIISTHYTIDISPNPFLKKITSYLVIRNNLIKEDIIKHVMSPSNIYLIEE